MTTTQQETTQMTTTTDTTTRPKAPKTPSPGQLRAVATLLDNATLPTGEAAAEALAEAATDVAAWLRYRAELAR